MPGEVVALFKETLAEWGKDKGSRLAAALAYYTLFSLGPLLLVAISVAGLVFGEDAARGQMAERIESLVGHEGAAAIQTIVGAASKQSSSALAAAVGVATIVLGAMGIFGALQDALNTIWDVEPKPRGGVMRMLRARLLSFAMVLGTGVVLLGSVVLSSVLAALVGLLSSVLDSGYSGFAIQGLDFVLSCITATLLFEVVFKVVPDTRIAWRDVLPGAAFTAFLFTMGKLAISMYLGRAGVGSAYGAAGSLVVLLVWIYLSAQIILFGAEFTHVYASRRALPLHRSHSKPSESDSRTIQQA